jgi:hypothetical protein
LFRAELVSTKQQNLLDQLTTATAQVLKTSASTSKLETPIATESTPQHSQHLQQPQSLSSLNPQRLHSVLHPSSHLKPTVRSSPAPISLTSPPASMQKINKTPKPVVSVNKDFATPVFNASEAAAAELTASNRQHYLRHRFALSEPPHAAKNGALKVVEEPKLPLPVVSLSEELARMAAEKEYARKSLKPANVVHVLSVTPQREQWTHEILAKQKEGMAKFVDVTPTRKIHEKI